MPVYIVECMSCGAPFEVESPVLPVAAPPAANITVPPHDKLNEPGVPCPDRQGIGISEKSEYVPRDKRT